MRPYLAIVTDSFREALHSRVLWLLGVMITLALCLLAPLGYQGRRTIELTSASVRNLPQFVLHLQKESAQSPRGIAGHLVSMFDDPLRNKLVGFKMPDEGDISGAIKFAKTLDELRGAINKQLPRRDFYQADVWQGRSLATEEGRVLLQKGLDKCSDEDVARLNRLLLEAAFPEYIDSSPPVSLQLRYLVWDVLSPLPFRHDQMVKFVELAVATVMKYAVGLVGVIVAVLVTASVIPQTFDPGSLNLLLSKPISRSLLFLSKFFGGCAFILCNAAYLISGLWLILGVRFGVWDEKLLYTIPIYLFMFAIYYAVSALAGVIWRNAIVSVALSVLFFLGCWLLGLVKWAAETRYVDPHRIVRLISAGDSLLAVNETGTTLEWDAAGSKWDSVFQSDVQRRLEPAVYVLGTLPAEIRPIGPVYDERQDRLISVQRSFGNGAAMTVYTGKRPEQWNSRAGRSASFGSLALVQEPDGSVAVISSLGIFRLVGNVEMSGKPEPLKVFGFSLPLPAVDPFVSVGPNPPLLIARPWSIATQPDTGELAIYSRGTLTLLRRGNDEKYERRLERVLPIDSSTAVVIGWAGNTLLVGRDDGVLVLYDDDTLDERGYWLTDDHQPPRFIESSPEGRWFAVTMHSGQLWLIDAERDEASEPAFARSRSVSATAFTGPDQLLVVDQGTRVTKYNVSDGQSVERFSPSPSIVDLAYDYFILPAYTVCPKPLRLDDTVTYLLSGKKALAGNRQDENDLSSSRRQLNPWDPVWSSAAFVIVMLGLSCLYLEWQDF